MVSDEIPEELIEARERLHEATRMLHDAYVEIAEYAWLHTEYEEELGRALDVIRKAEIELYKINEQLLRKAGLMSEEE